MSSAHLIVTRDRDNVGLLRTYRVLLDGERVARLGRCQSCDLPVSPGRHVLRVAVDWTRSPDLPIELGPDETAYVLCRSAGNVLTAPLWGVLRPRRALALRRVSDASGTSDELEPRAPLPDTAPVPEWFKRRRASGPGEGPDLPVQRYMKG